MIDAVGRVKKAADDDPWCGGALVLRGNVDRFSTDNLVNE
jgi:hypothetical protein